MVENATLLFKNFEGKELQYNNKGDRNFNIVLSEDVAARLDADGWNVKILKPKEEGDEERLILEVRVRFDIYPPKIILISNGGKTRTVIDEEMVSLLDSADIENWDIMIVGNHWQVGEKGGIKANLKSAYVTLREDELDRKYGVNPTS